MSQKKLGPRKENRGKGEEPTTSACSVNKEKRSRNQPKIVNDPIWGPIKLDPVCVKIINTPEFQRLRYIKQLGGVSFVYPGACHTRFEHSIGTSYLAGLLVRTLKSNICPDDGITIDERDILCAEIAGLCHELGHGAFSHLFDLLFIPRIEKHSQWTHEKASIEMLDRIFNKIGDDVARSEETRVNLNDSKDRNFIKGLIYGKKKLGQQLENNSDKNKDFLYEVVANEENKIDVDKWDYFSRDCHMLGLEHSFQIKRTIMLARVIKHDDGFHISFPKSEYMNIFDMYHTRYLLHRRAYQHPVKQAVELMITDALCFANKKLKYRVENIEEGVELSKTIHYMDAYTLVTDGVIDRIRFENFGNDGDCEKAKEIIERIYNHDWYKCKKKSGMERKVARVKIVTEQAVKSNDLKIKGYQQKIEEWDIHIEPTVFNYGAKEKNPMDDVYFYDRDGASTKAEDEKSDMLPAVFEETYLRMYWRKNDTDEKKFKDAIHWFQNLTELILEGVQKKKSVQYIF